MKKLLSIILTVALILCAVPLGAFTLTASAATSGYYTYTVSNGEATITDVDTYISGDITIPSTLDGYPVTSIGGYAFSDCSSLTSITIPDSVTSIGDWAFYGCSSLLKVNITDIAKWCNIDFGGSASNPLCYAHNLYLNGTKITNLVIPDGITSIGSYAFFDCSSLTSITIPDSVTSIGDFAFNGCSSLTSVTIPDSVTSIGDCAFSGCSSLTSVTIPNSVTSIGDCAFSDCNSLTSVTIPDSVTSIGSYAFYGCSSLTSVTIPNSVTSIGYSAFSGCSSLTSITIPDCVTSIRNNAFSGCSRLTTINVDSNNQNYSSQDCVLFNKNKTELICCPGGKAGAYTIPDSVTSIGDSAFSDCSSLTSVTIPDSVTSIGQDAFYNCSRLTSVTIPDSVTSIGSGAFYNCSSLTSVTIPDSVTSIGNCAFEDCKSLTSITIPDSVTSIGEYAFSGCSRLTTINVDSNNQNYSSQDCVLFNKNKTELICCPGGKAGAYTIPDSVTSIGSSAFYNCSSLTSITIPDSVTSIGDWAFSGCSSLTSITIPDSVTSIGNCAFEDCKSLTSITIPDSVTSIGNCAFEDCKSLTSITIPDSVTSIGSGAFYNCSSLTSVTIGNSVTSIGGLAFYGCSRLTSVTIPDSVTSIGNYAFSYCSSLTSITIPDSVTSIGYRTFEDCNSLTDVYYIGSKTEADNIDIGSGNYKFEDAKWYYCGTEVITPTETGIYSIAPNALKVFDEQNKGLIYKDGWSLVKGKNYTVIFENDNDSEFKYSLAKNIDDLFPDTNSGAWYNDAVTYAVGRGIISGYGNGNFGPADSIQRQDFLVILARFDGVDLSQYTGSSRFADVQTGSYYAAAVNWGAEKGIVNGYQNGCFGVSDVITREQLVTFLCRYASSKGIDVSYSNTTAVEASRKYGDYSQVSDWSLDCVLWALENNVINGKNANTSSPTIAPQGNAQRCEVAQIMYNIFQNNVF